MDPILAALLANGLPGAVIAALIVWLWRKDKELADERKAHLDDAKNFTTMALQLQAQALKALERVDELFQELKRRGPLR